MPRVLPVSTVMSQPFEEGEKVWCDYTTTGKFKVYTVAKCYKARHVCQSGWLVETQEGIQTSFKDWKKFYHGIDSDWFHKYHPRTGQAAGDE